MKNPQSNLPPGFRFHPTDEELILHYLKKKITSTPFPVSIIADVDIYKFDPWNLPAKAAFGEKEWYFFSPRDRKYPNGARPNRAAGSGYWKATGTDKIIMAPRLEGGQNNIGVKKALVFYVGKPPKGVKTNWIMHEYRLTDAPSYNNHTNKPVKKSKDSSMRLDDWVLCRIYMKTHANLVQSTTATIHSDHDQEEEERQFVQETSTHNLKSPISNKTTLLPHKPSSFSNLLDAMDYPLQSNFYTDNQLDPIGYDPNQILNGVFDQTFFKYSNFTSSANCNNNSGYLFQKLPQLNSTTTSSAITTTIPNMENKLKRQLSSIEGDVILPSKKLANYCCFTNTNSSIDMDQQYNIFLNQPLFNQQLLLSPHLQFQG